MAFTNTFKGDVMIIIFHVPVVFDVKLKYTVHISIEFNPQNRMESSNFHFVNSEDKSIF